MLQGSTPREANDQCIIKTIVFKFANMRTRPYITGLCVVHFNGIQAILECGSTIPSASYSPIQAVVLGTVEGILCIQMFFEMIDNDSVWRVKIQI